MAPIFSTPIKLLSYLRKRPEQVVQWIILAGVLVFVTAFALVSYKLSLTYLLLLAGFLPAIAFLFIVIREPGIGLLFTLLGGIFIPITGPSGINITVLGVILLLGVWLFKMMVESERLALVASRVVTPILVFLVSSFLSFVFGQLPWYSFANQAPIDAQIGGWLIFILSGGLFLVVPHLIKDLIWLKRITWVFLAVGGFYVVGRALEINFFDVLYQNGFIANSMYWTWLAALAFGQLLMNDQLKPFWRLTLIGLLVVTGYVAYFINGDWKSGYIPALVAIATMIALRYPKLAFALSPVGVLGLLLVANQAIATDEYSWGTRIDAWLIVLNIAKISPILGMGFANYSFYTTLFPIRGYYNIRFNSHSQYVDLIAQTGLVGLAVFLWMILEVSFLGWKLRAKVQDGFSKGYVYGVLGGIAGSIVAAFLVDWLLPYVYNIGFNGFRGSILPWIFFGGLVTIEQLVKSNQVKEVE